jgi:peroxiredoxin
MIANCYAKGKTMVLVGLPGAFTLNVICNTGPQVPGYKEAEGMYKAYVFLFLNVTVLVFS